MRPGAEPGSSCGCVGSVHMFCSYFADDASDVADRGDCDGSDDGDFLHLRLILMLLLIFVLLLLLMMLMMGDAVASVVALPCCYVRFLLFALL